ncbi:MAG: hypothetical protein IPL45_03445 [Actinomycetales bacterium]|nr:hypothetical protein [Actinomycetales bacterium]
MRSELLRLRSRQAIVAIVLCAAGLLLALMVGQVLAHTDDYASAREAFVAQRTLTYEDDLQSYRATLDSVGVAQMPVGSREVSLAEYLDGQEFTGGVADIPTRRFVTATLTSEMAKIASVVAAIAAFTVGATSAGAEWAAATLPALLTWEPRRLRFVVAKMLAIAALAVALAVVLHGIVLGLSWVGGAWRGTLEGLTTSWWVDAVQTAARGTLIAALASAAGFHLSLLTRSTGFAVGVGFLYPAVVESVLQGLRPEAEQWTIRGTAGAFLDGGTALLIPQMDQPLLVVTIAALPALLTVLAYAVPLAMVSALVFTRRDIT